MFAKKYHRLKSKGVIISLRGKPAAMGKHAQKMNRISIAIILSLCMVVSACKFRQTSFASTAEASAACYAWRSEGKKITMKIKINEGGKIKSVKIRTYNRECRYDSTKNEYGGYEIKDFSGGGTTNDQDKAYKIKQFRIVKH